MNEESTTANTQNIVTVQPLNENLGFGFSELRMKQRETMAWHEAFSSDASMGSGTIAALVVGINDLLMIFLREPIEHLQTQREESAYARTRASMDEYERMAAVAASDTTDPAVKFATKAYLFCRAGLWGADHEAWSARTAHIAAKQGWFTPAALQSAIEKGDALAKAVETMKSRSMIEAIEGYIPISAGILDVPFEDLTPEVAMKTAVEMAGTNTMARENVRSNRNAADAVDVHMVHTVISDDSETVHELIALNTDTEKEPIGEIADGITLESIAKQAQEASKDESANMRAKELDDVSGR